MITSEHKAGSLTSILTCTVIFKPLLFISFSWIREKFEHFLFNFPGELHSLSFLPLHSFAACGSWQIVILWWSLSGATSKRWLEVHTCASHCGRLTTKKTTALIRPWRWIKKRQRVKNRWILKALHFFRCMKQYPIYYLTTKTLLLLLILNELIFNYVHKKKNKKTTSIQSYLF